MTSQGAKFRVSAVTRSFVLVAFFFQYFLVMTIDDCIHVGHSDVADLHIVPIEELVELVTFGKMFVDKF